MTKAATPYATALRAFCEVSGIEWCYISSAKAQLYNRTKSKKLQFFSHDGICRAGWYWWWSSPENQLPKSRWAYGPFKSEIDALTDAVKSTKKGE